MLTEQGQEFLPLGFLSDKGMGVQKELFELEDSAGQEKRWIYHHITITMKNEEGQGFLPTSKRAGSATERT